MAARSSVGELRSAASPRRSFRLPNIARSVSVGDSGSADGHALRPKTRAKATVAAIPALDLGVIRSVIAARPRRAYPAIALPIGPRGAADQQSPAVVEPDNGPNRSTARAPTGRAGCA